MNEIQNLIMNLKDLTLEQSFDIPTTEKERCIYLCQRANEMDGTLHLEDGYNCDKCKNKGYIEEPMQYAGHWAEKYIPCECMTARASLRELMDSGLGDIARKCTFERFKATEPWQQKLKEAAMAYAETPGESWFFIGGQSGCGKSHLCTAICRKLIENGNGLHYMEWRDEIVRIKATINDNFIYQNMIERLKNTTVLYIDDLFKTGKGNDGTPQRPTAADINIAFEVINARYRQPQKLTIISSECTLPEIADIDEAIAGRIAERAVSTGYGFTINKDKKKNYRFQNMNVM